MNLRPVGKNQTILKVGNDKEIFFSYQTPVCAWIQGKFYKTSEHFSRTTSRHINSFLGKAKAEEKPQSFFDSLV